jgi:hypothetical protein
MEAPSGFFLEDRFGIAVVLGEDVSADRLSAAEET